MNFTNEENPEKDGSVLVAHISNAIANGEDSVYFLVRSIITTTGKELQDDDSYFKFYNSASVSRAPALVVSSSTISSAVSLAETGYVYTVSGLDTCADAVQIVVAVYDSQDTLIKIVTSGDVPVPADGTIDVDIPGTGIAGLKAYIWKAGLLEPITYPETIVLD